MARYISGGDTQEDIRHYQTLLIPLNIFVCVLCLVSIFTMMFAPFLRIDLGKIISDDEVRAYVKDTISSALRETTNNTNSASVSGDWVLATQDDSYQTDGTEITLSDELIAEITGAVVDPLLEEMGKSDISLNFTAFSSMKVLLGGGEAFKKELAGILTHFAKGLVEAIWGLFDNSTIVNMVVENALPALIDAGIDSIKNDPDIDPDIRNEIASWTPEQVETLKNNVLSLKNTTTPAEFEDELVKLAPNLMLVISGTQMTQSDIDAFRSDMHKTIQETVDLAAESGNAAGTYNYNLEAFLCIQISKEVDIENLDKMFSDIIENGDSSGNGNVDIGDSNGDGNNKIYTSFAAMMKDMGGTKDTINTTINDAVAKALDEADESLETISQVYGFLFIFFAVFMGLWFILFLFALLHIFAKNKRFVMWYVKLLCWIPGIIWLALTLAGTPSVVTAIAGVVGASDLPIGVLTAVIGGISSWGTGVSYICYWILWIVSIFWAFPIKHKIRKLNKQAKLEANY